MKPIKGFEQYLITKEGKVFSEKKNRFLSIQKMIDNSGNERNEVCLSKNGKTHRYKISRLLALAFIPNPLNLPWVDHINRIPNDDRIENLRWSTPSENNCNKEKNKDKTYSSPYKGVYFCNTWKRFVAIGYWKKGRKYLGVSKDPKELAVLYNDWATKMFGEFAVLNKI